MDNDDLEFAAYAIGTFLIILRERGFSDKQITEMFTRNKVREMLKAIKRR